MYYVTKININISFGEKKNLDKVLDKVSSDLMNTGLADFGYIPQFKASNARDLDEVSSDLARMLSNLTVKINASVLI